MSSSSQPTPLDSVDELYFRRNYPAMSHPVSDPAVSAVAARLAGLKPPDPAHARILEIGCGSGHNLIPLAIRWPDATFLGLDISEDVISQARKRADACGLKNISFATADIRNCNLDLGWDYIIAHGFFSWVADDVKAALLKLCARHLTANGIATISFNVLAGWEQRLPLIEIARKIRDDHGCDEITALNVMRAAIEDEHLLWIIDDMLAKGPEILFFDDFAPVMDAWPFDRFVAACGQAGLRWLGESDPAENIPSSLDAAARAELLPLAGDPVKMQMAADEMAGTSFRSGVLCRADAPTAARITTAVVFDFSICLPRDIQESQPPEMARVVSVLRDVHPHCVPVAEVLRRLGEYDAPSMARTILEAIQRGELLARIEPVVYDAEPGLFPSLNPFRLGCARDRLPLVDAWHLGCAFPAGHYELLAAMDGSRTAPELKKLAAEICPELDFDPWLAHLADRGMFSIC